ncbi:unnamed protein product [Pieris brassicae]|uniref:Transporter n=1 Tax=Pieris brassicae TaxID=7116 RepID=A0A9P0X8Q8_PIEBR|nr:unnamed protein product [Pieris brassicae]
MGGTCCCGRILATPLAACCLGKASGPSVSEPVGEPAPLDTPLFSHDAPSAIRRQLPFTGTLTITQTKGKGDSPVPERRSGEFEETGEMHPPEPPPAHATTSASSTSANTQPTTNKLPKSRSMVVSLTPPRERETWAKKAEFLLAVVGFAVDLGNVWRFPYICYQNGGGAFLIPYCVMLLFGGLPLFFMELALGQYHRCGCLTLWKRICPALKGVGYAICMIDIYMGMYYNTIIGWAVYYLIASLASINSELPWTSCDNEWNTPLCTPVTSPLANISSSTPAKEFFERNVLEQHRSNGLDDMGPIKPSLALCVFGVFVLVYFSLWKGVRSAGKVVWVTALAPYVVLLILLARGVTLPGATEGIRYYLTPEWHKLQNSKVWIDAASQIFFSLGPGFGTLLALSSYNKFNNNCYRDAIITSSINCLTSFLAGFVIFSVLGYMAHVQNKSIEDVGLEGPGLVFIVYPEAIATMTGSVFWAIIFFLMLITLGLDSTFGGLEAVTTALCDEYPRALGRHRELFVAGLLVFIYICALPTTTYGGVYLVDLLNVYGPGLAILFVVFAEAAGVCWVYGVDRFADDVKSMLGHKPGWFWRACWVYISPVFLLVLFVFSVLSHAEMLGGEYVYPPWSISVGWALTGTTVSLIPLYILYLFIITPGSFCTNLSESQLESVARWLSCNGEAWGMGPTAVFASAAALFLFNELQATIFVAGDHAHVSLLERTLVVALFYEPDNSECGPRQSPNILLEMTTAGFLGKSDLVPLGPLTRFLKQQQPQIHITICWFLSLCYADYVRKHYCTRFNMPYLEQWQAELHARASRGLHQTIQKVNSFVGAVHTRLRGYTQTPAEADTHTEVGWAAPRRWRSAEPEAACRLRIVPAPPAIRPCARHYAGNLVPAWSARQARPRRRYWTNSEHMLRKPDARVAIHRSPATLVLALEPPRRARSLEPPWRNELYDSFFK